MTFNMSEAWRDATATMGRNREVLLIVAGLFFFLPSLVLNFAMGDAQELAVADPKGAEGALVAIYSQWAWLVVLIGIVSMVGSLALLALLRDHDRPTVGEAIKAGLVGLLPALGTYFLMAFGALLIVFLTIIVLGPIAGVDGENASMGQLMLLGAVAFALMIYPAVKFSLSIPVIAIDKVHNPLKALGRSWRLTKGSSLGLFLFYFLLFVVYFVLALVAAMITGALALIVGPDAGLIVSALVSGALSAATSVVIVAVIAAAHRQLAGPSAAAVSQTFE
ncbi:MAG TPA: hypothetical protein VI168_11505 [Croceibacterium sp.]